ncbi:TIGD6 [Cordylochernes scorpioides]|uniref:TIGD6 n=1 Tax=Cordylochernes scorpioides TaxID=51811 RepID=A0ABY6LNQ0_9ARAC|nr:TIGD6 [Cordylochernes scorpioides]
MNIPSNYHFNKKAWMTGEIFTDWLKKLDQIFKRRERKILLILDNCPAHQIPEGLQNIEIRFLPALTTTLKDQYRKQMITYLLTCMEEKKNAQVHLLFAISWLEAAWVGVSSSTIKNCFSHSGFVMDAMEEVVEEEMNRCFEALKKHQTIDVNYIDFLEVDKDVQVAGEQSIEEIVKEVMGKEEDEEDYPKKVKVEDPLEELRSLDNPSLHCTSKIELEPWTMLCKSRKARWQLLIREKTWRLASGHVDDPTRRCQKRLASERPIRRCGPGCMCIASQEDVQGAKDTSDGEKNGKLTDLEIEKFKKLLILMNQKVDEFREDVRSIKEGITPLESRLSRLEHNRNVKRSATLMSCEVKVNVLLPGYPDGFSKTITATKSPCTQCLRGQKTRPGDEDPGKTITTKTITSGDVVSGLSESTLEDSPMIRKSEKCRQQEMIQTGCVAQEDELITSVNGCGTSVLYQVKRTEGEYPPGDTQCGNLTLGIHSEILHENNNNLSELQCDSVADFCGSDRLSGTTTAIQLDGTELDAPWKCDKARWSKHPEVGAGDPTEWDRALDALWKSDDNVCDTEVARNVSALWSAMQAENMCHECVPIILVPLSDKVQIQQLLLKKSSTDVDTATGSDTSSSFKKPSAGPARRGPGLKGLEKENF